MVVTAAVVSDPATNANTPSDTMMGRGGVTSSAPSSLLYTSILSLGTQED